MCGSSNARLTPLPLTPHPIGRSPRKGPKYPGGADLSERLVSVVRKTLLAFPLLCLSRGRCAPSRGRREQGKSGRSRSIASGTSSRQNLRSAAHQERGCETRTHPRARGERRSESSGQGHQGRDLVRRKGRRNASRRASLRLPEWQLVFDDDRPELELENKAQS